MANDPHDSRVPRLGLGGLAAAAALLASAPVRAEDGPLVKFHPIHIGAFTEYGKIVEGSRVEAYGSFGVITNQSLTTSCAWLVQSATVNDRLDIDAGISGLFWYSFPVSDGLPHTRLIKFATGVPVADAVYSFGDLESPWLKLQMGLFGYKYNPDATNLGEYLYRSGTYPGYLWTGGWVLTNAARYNANGIRAGFEFLDHRLKLDVNFLIERDIEPNFDISPSVVGSYNVGGFFEVGAGAVFAHYIPANADKVTPKDRANAYYHDPVRNRDLPLPQFEHNKPGLEIGDTLIVDAADPKAGQPLSQTDPRFVEGKVTQYYTAADNGIPNSQLDYYTFKGIKLMGRASLDVLKPLNVEMLEPGAGKIYAEVAVLGLENQPFYYEKIGERMPMMFGFNIPTFKILDQLSVEVERYKSPFANSIKTEFNNTLPIWDLPLNAKGETDPGMFLDSNMAVKGRDWYWSVYARKTFVPGLSLYGQIAHDHTRVMNYFANPSYQPFIQEKKDWYWALRLESAI
jgi:hypothetical protein